MLGRAWRRGFRWTCTALFFVTATLAYAAPPDPGVYSLLTGPFGGVLAVAFGMGAAAGYGFSARTVLKMSRDRIEEIKAESDKRIAEIKDDQAKAERACADRVNGLEASVEYLRSDNARMREDWAAMVSGTRKFGVFRESYPIEPPPKDMTDKVHKLDEKGVQE